MSSISDPISVHPKVSFRPIFQVLPGVLLLAAIGYLGKLTEQGIARYGKAHNLHLPNIEYVLWAIIYGLIISNPWRAGYFSNWCCDLRVLAETGHRIPWRAFSAGRHLETGRAESWFCRVGTWLVYRADDRAGQMAESIAETDVFASDRFLDMRRVRYHRRERSHRCGR